MQNVCKSCALYCIEASRFDRRISVRIEKIKNSARLQHWTPRSSVPDSTVGLASPVVYTLICIPRKNKVKTFEGRARPPSRSATGWCDIQPGESLISTSAEVFQSLMGIITLEQPGSSVSVPSWGYHIYSSGRDALQCKNWLRGWVCRTLEVTVCLSTAYVGSGTFPAWMTTGC